VPTIEEICGVCAAPAALIDIGLAVADKQAVVDG